MNDRNIHTISNGEETPHMTQVYDVIVIGSGPAGLFAALTLEHLGVDTIAVVDRTRYTAGGLLNDGKLNLDSRIGFDLDDLALDHESIDRLINRVKCVFTAFDACRQVTFPSDQRVTSWQHIARERDVEFIAPEQWHWGTDNGKKVVDYLRNLLVKTTFYLETEVTGIEPDDQSLTISCTGPRGEKRLTGHTLLCAPGRQGAYWFRRVANEIGIDNSFGPIDVGIRIELNRRFFDPVTDVVYDPKFIIKTKRHRDRVRTFCTNPGGRVRFEHYGDFKLINGDALAGRKTENTNFALLNTVRLTQPFSDSTLFGHMIAKQFHLLGGGTPIVQRVGDFREGSRSRTETFNSTTRHFNLCTPTCAAVPGDISLGIPARIIDNLWESLKTLDKIVPGILHPSTLMYAPEIKFFDTHFHTDKHLETNIPRIFVAGDGVGKSRGIVGSAVTGIIAAEGIARKYGSHEKNRR